MRSSKAVGAIAIDGPAGSGKSTVSKRVAEKLGVLYVDTGAMYRALTLKVMAVGIKFDDEKAITELSSDLDLELLPPERSGATIRVVLDGKDVSEDIRTLEVTGNVKYVAKIASVRENLVRLQREMVADADGSVMEGRDIGTVVLPGARCKFYVDAKFEERVNRRLAELIAKGKAAARDEVADDLKQRDHADTTRKVGALKIADDAVYVDTTDLTIEEVVEKITEHVRETVI